MLRLGLYIAGVCLLAAVSAQHTAEEWKSRVIYHILTDRFSKPGDGTDAACVDLSDWCGGNFNGIVDRLDYIEELGATAIWISPFILNTPGGYHGYWAKNLYEVDPNYGTEAELLNLIEKCHERDIWVMMDVVPNHMGYPHDCKWPNPPTCDETKLVNFTGLTPFDQAEHYHEICNIEDWENQTQIELCRLANLPDLNQTVPEVRQLLLDWIRNTTTKYKFDGYRVDTVRHIELPFWGEYQAASNNFLLGEVWNEDPFYVAAYQQEMDSLFNFPLHEQMRQVFTYRAQNMTFIADGLVQQRAAFRDTQVLGVFVDNHDKPRFLNFTQDLALLKNAVTFSLLTDGIPFVYYGTEQAYSGGADPECRESLWPNYNTASDMFKFHQTLIRVRKENIGKMLEAEQREVYVDSDSLVFSRGNHKVLGAVTNVGTGVDDSFTVTFSETDNVEGRDFINAFDADDVIRVTNNELPITLMGGLPKVYVMDGDSHNAAISLHSTSLLLCALAAIVTTCALW